MLINKYIIVATIFIVLNIITIIVGRFITSADWAIVMFLALDYEMGEDSAISYIILIGILNDFFSSFLFGSTSIIFLMIMFIRFIYIRNFNFSELRNVRLAYYISAILFYVVILLIFNGYSGEPFLLYLFKHFFINAFLVILLKNIMEKQFAI